MASVNPVRMSRGLSLLSALGKARGHALTLIFLGSSGGVNRFVLFDFSNS